MACPVNCCYKEGPAPCAPAPTPHAPRRVERCPVLKCLSSPAMILNVFAEWIVSRQPTRGGAPLPPGLACLLVALFSLALCGEGGGAGAADFADHMPLRRACYSY